MQQDPPRTAHLSPLISFGHLVRVRRRQLGLTQRQLSQTVACAEITLRKIEADQRAASPQLAQLLADSLRLDAHERERYIRAAVIQAVDPGRAPRGRAVANQPPPDEAHKRYVELGDLLLRRYHDAPSQRAMRDMTGAHADMRALFEWQLRNAHADAQRLAGGLYEYWIKSNRLTEGRGWCEQALMLDAASGIERAFALLGAGALAAFQSDYAHARGRLDECVACVTAQPASAADPAARVMAFALHMRGWVALHAGEPHADIVRWLEAASAAFDALGDTLRGAHVRCDLAMAHAFSYRAPGLAESTRLASAALAVFEAEGSAFGQSLAQGMLAESRLLLGDRPSLESARLHAQRALDGMREHGNGRDVAWALLRLSVADRKLGDLDGAQAQTEEALKLFYELNEKTALCFCMQNLAQILRTRGAFDAARKRLAVSLNIGHELHNRPAVLSALSELIEIELLLGAAPRAVTLLGALDARRDFLCDDNSRAARIALEERVRAAASELAAGDVAAARARGAAMPLRALVAWISQP